MKRNLILLLTLCHSTLLIYSQNTTNSPTSMFGLGELSTGEGGQYSGLGGAGIALQSYNFLNTANPASLTAIEGQRFLIDAGVMGAYKVYTQTGTSNHSLVGNLNNLSIGCRITPRWYGAVFMAPVSSVGYAITQDQDITAVPPYRHSSKAKADCLKWESVQPIDFSRDFLSALTFPT